MRVARIPYLNAAPFHASWGTNPPFDVVDMVPSALGRAAREGEIDAGLMAVADYIDLKSEFVLVAPPMGVAVRGHVGSVVLLSNDRPQDLGGRRIALTAESSTSSRLLKLLARGRWGVEPEWVDDTQGGSEVGINHAGLLLIGDRALSAMAAPDRWGWVRATDLAAEWWAWQKLPFTFAAWVVRADRSDRERDRLGGFLVGALSVGRQRFERIAREHAGSLGEPDDLERYLRQFTYRLLDEELEAIERFEALLTEHDVETGTPAPRPR